MDSTNYNKLIEVKMKTDTAVAIMLRHIFKNAAHIAWIMFAKTFHVESPEYAQLKLHIYARTVGSAIGNGTLGRNTVVARGEPLPNQLMAFQRKAVAIAETAAAALDLSTADDLYKPFVDEVWISALASAVACGRFKAPHA